MLKKIITSTVAAALLAGHSAAATAAPVAFESADRAASPVTEAEEFAGGSELLLILGFAAIAALIIFLVEDSENDFDDLPASP